MPAIGTGLDPWSTNLDVWDPTAGGASGGGGFTPPTISDPPPPPPDPPYQPGPPITTGAGMSTQEFLDRIRNDPAYQYEYDRYFGPNGYYALQKNVITAGSGGGGGGYIPDYSKLKALAEKQAGAQKTEAQRDAEIQAIFNRERRASMGQATSGTGFVERDNDAKELEYLLGQIDIGLEQQLEQYAMSERAAAAAAAQASAARARAAAVDQAQLAMLQWEAQGKSFNILKDAAGRVMDLTFDPNTGVYRGPNGFSITPAELGAALGGLQA